VIPFRDLRRETTEIRRELDAALEATLAEGRFVGGGAVERFEVEFAASCGAAHAVGVGSGTDAITIALRACGVGPGDEVVTAANTCVPTVAGIAASGAVPVLADVDPVTLTLDVESVRSVLGPRTRALVPVHLYGRPARLEALLDLSRAHDLRVVEDAAHAHGIRVAGAAAAFSFYPTKNLGALGDAGAVVTSEATVAQEARALREYGVRAGVAERRASQSRLDTMQAAVLSVKLGHLAAWNGLRRELAAAYTAAFADGPVVPPLDERGHVYHLYVVRTPERDELRQRLRARGIETFVHYHPAVHLHPAWSGLPRAASLAESERAALEVLSLPLHPQLGADEQRAVIEAVYRS
jgi:dTDP-4-amino-4,6-dideoxygalactose transaminase